MGKRGIAPLSVPLKTCMACGARLERKRLPSGIIEAHNDFLARKHCNRQCASKSRIGSSPPTRLKQAMAYIAKLEATIDRLKEAQAKSEERRDTLEAEQYQALAHHSGQESAKPMVCVGCGVHYGDACTPDCAVAKALAD